MSTAASKSIDSGFASDPWIERLQNSDDQIRDAAIRELSDLLVRGLSKAMSQRYGGGLQAEDVVQETLIKILDSLDQFEGRSRFTTWAMTIANRIAISKMRRKYFQDVSIETFEKEDSMRIEVAVDDTNSSSQQLERKSLLDKLQQVIDSDLTDKQRLAIRASLEGMPVEVIAEKAGGNRNSVYKLVHDARQKLRLGLENAGIAAEDIATAFA